MRASTEQLDLTSSCMLHRSSYDSLSEEEESDAILERSPHQTVFRTASQEDRIQMMSSSVSGNQQVP